MTDPRKTIEDSDGTKHWAGAWELDEQDPSNKAWLCNVYMMLPGEQVQQQAEVCAHKHGVSIRSCNQTAVASAQAFLTTGQFAFLMPGRASHVYALLLAEALELIPSLHSTNPQPNINFG